MIRRNFCKAFGFLGLSTLLGWKNEAVASLASKKESSNCLTTGYPEIDEAIGGGLKKGHLYTIFGLTGSGKSKFAKKIFRSNPPSLTCLVFSGTENDFLYLEKDIKERQSQLVVIDAEYNGAFGSEHEFARNQKLQQLAIKCNIVVCVVRSANRSANKCDRSSNSLPAAFWGHSKHAFYVAKNKITAIQYENKMTFTVRDDDDEAKNR